MRELNAIVDAYTDVELALEGLRETAVKSGNLKKVERIERKQLINDHAYFVLCFAQLETAIDDKCRAAIKARSDASDWGRRRGWDIYNPSDRRLSGLSFEDRVALVVDKRARSVSSFSEILKYYNLRNKAAHGKFDATRIDIASVAVVFRKLVGLLAP